MSLVGRHIGRYRILEQLGQGGMSVVYKGLDTALDREVAVKVLHPHLSGKEESRRRLAREAKAVAKLHHPNILEVFDCAAAESSDAYIVCEYIRGQTLRQYAATHAFEPPEVAAMVVHEIASALAHAHDAGVIHRDLKPENVMVRDDGVLKLMDFGIAKILDRDDRMTMTGALVGSPAHMAPEIIEGHEAGPDADVFSLGTMLYLFATSRLPFVGPNTTATLKRVLDGIYEDPRQLVPTLSDDLAEIIAHCLMRQPSQRYPNAGKLRDALAAYLSDVGLPRPGEELASFFADPPSYRKDVTRRLCESLISRSEALLQDRRPARALAGLNQVLALDGGNARALELLKQMNAARQKDRTRRLTLKVTSAAVLASLVAAGAFFTHQALTRSPDFEPVIARLGTELPLPPELFPQPPSPSRPEPSALSDEPPPTVPAKASPHPASKQGPPEAPETASTGRAEVRVFPFGDLLVDGEKVDQGKEWYAITLPLGKHRVAATCDELCLPEGTSKEIEVTGNGKAVAAVAVRLRPSSILFRGTPAAATVSVRGISKPLSDATFQIEGEPTQKQLRHTVAFEVSAPGYEPLHDTLHIVPGQVVDKPVELVPQ